MQVRSKQFLPTAALCIAAASISFLIFGLASDRQLARPENALGRFANAVANGDLDGALKPLSSASADNFVGHFGARRYEQVRSAYQASYDAAAPLWQEYRNRAQQSADKEHAKLLAKILELGRASISDLPMEDRLKMTEDREHYDDMVFQRGLQALPSADRKRIQDPSAFKNNADRISFADREAWILISDEDRKTLGSAAALSSALTTERRAFLVANGAPRLPADQKLLVSRFPSAELASPRAFMLRYGPDLAKEFLNKAAVTATAASRTHCSYPEADTRGSFFLGTTASCEMSLLMRGNSHQIRATLTKENGDWKISSMEPQLFEIGDAFPRVPSPTAQPAIEQSEQIRPTYQQTDAEIVVPALPRASWEAQPENVPTATSEAGSMLAGFIALRLVTPGFWLTAAGLFLIVMSANFKRLRNESFAPEWLEGEQQLEELVVPSWTSRVSTRLTTRRLIQVRLSWFFSRRKIYAIALDDVHSITWRRYTNWALVLIGAYFFGTINPIALLLLMWGLECKILSIRFGTPFAQMPFTRMAIFSFRRRHFNDLARFYKKAQLAWAQTRTQEQAFLPRDIRFIAEEDKDFCWGFQVWSLVSLLMLAAFIQRLSGSHIRIDDAWGGILLGSPVALSIRSLRNGMWVAVLGAVGMFAVKFPGTLPLAYLTDSSDGRFPNIGQFLGIVAFLCISCLTVRLLIRFHSFAAFMTPFLWFGALSLIKPQEVYDLDSVAVCLLAVACAAAVSLADEYLTGRLARSHAGANARAASA